MTNLTEQWKKGEFIICNAGKCQYYYVRNEEQQEVIKTEYCLFDDNTPNWQILAPVPSYDEWQGSENYIDYLKQCISVYESKDKQATETSIAYNELAEENEQLKELLKECIPYVEYHIIREKHVGFTPQSANVLHNINQVLGEE